ncbi:MAG: hypothetical protein JSS51_07595 [Planctomycetes bacterium]|nr:hypothetical protein [Planctomycetota bacterium]
MFKFLLAAGCASAISSLAMSQCADIYPVAVLSSTHVTIYANYVGDCGTVNSSLSGLAASSFSYGIDYTYTPMAECPYDGNLFYAPLPVCLQTATTSPYVASCGSEGYGSASGGSGVIELSAQSYTEIRTANFQYSYPGLVGVKYEIDSGAAAGNLTVSHTGGTTCDLEITQYASVNVQIYGGGASRSPARTFEISKYHPSGQFCETVYTFSPSGSARNQGLAGSLSDGTPVALGIFEGLSFSTSGDETSGSDEVQPTVTVPANTTSFTAHSSSRSFIANGDVTVDHESDYDDLVAMQAANGLSIGDNGYIPEADLNLDGTIDASDFAILRVLGCPADYTYDGIVDDSDFTIFANAYNTLTSSVGDFNGDGLTDDADFSYFVMAYDDTLCPELTDLAN